MNPRRAAHRRLLACSVTVCFVLLASLPAFAQVRPPSTGTVTLPLAEYDRLLDRAANPPTPRPLPPIPSAVARADLALRASPDALRGTLTLHGEVWREGMVKVPLLQGGTVIDAQQGVSPVPLVADGPTTAAVLQGPSPFTISVSWGAELASEPGRLAALLPAVHAGSVHATIELPGENTDVRADRGIINSKSAAGGKTIVNLTLEPGAASRVSWSSRESAAPAAREVHLVSDVKSVVTIADGETRLGALFDVTVVSGDAEAVAVLLPSGFDVASITGATVESEGVRDGRLRLALRERARRRHQFLLALERTAAGSPRMELSAPAIDGAQRETGEIALEATGTVELNAPESGLLRRLDVTEVSDSTLTLAKSPLLAAFRYQRRNAERVALAFEVKRFADAPVVAAAVERADVTTLITAEGRTLTEVSLVMRNRGQQFLKLGLPPGASVVSAEIGGESVKPVEGNDGARVPLVRPGFQPPGAYAVSFVYVASGSPLGKKGEATLSLPRMDVPVNVLQWELFVPDIYEVKRFEGDLLPQELIGTVNFLREAEAPRGGIGMAPAPVAVEHRMETLEPDDVGGFCTDHQGGVLPGVKVTLTQGHWTQSAVTDARGAFIFRTVPAGPHTVRAELPGFVTVEYQVRPGGPPVLLTLGIGTVSEMVRVTTETPHVEQQPRDTALSQAASQNVLNLQRRVSGVLPVRMDVPRAGRSYVLVRPLVIDEPTTVKFEYKSR